MSAGVIANIGRNTNVKGDINKMRMTRLRYKLEREQIIFISLLGLTLFSIGAGVILADTEINPNYYTEQCEIICEAKNLTFDGITTPRTCFCYDNLNIQYKYTIGWKK